MLVFYLVFSTLIRLVRPCSMYHISLNNKRGDYLLFRIKKERMIIRGRRLFQILVTRSGALNILFYYPDK